MPLSYDDIDKYLDEVSQTTQQTQSTRQPTGAISRQVDYGEFIPETIKQVALSAIQTGGRTLRHMIPGEEDPTKTNWFERNIIQKPYESQQKYLQEYAQEGMPTKDWAQAAASIGYSVTAGGAGLIAEKIASIPSLGLPNPASIGAMGATTLGVAYGATRDQKLEELYQVANETAIRERGASLTNEEWKQIAKANDYRNQAGKYGLYEAIPEAIGDVLGYKIIKHGVPLIKPAFGAFGRSAIGKIAGRGLATQVTEQATEAYTGAKQSEVDTELYGTPSMSMGEAFGEQWKSVGITTMALGGMAGAYTKGQDLLQTRNLRNIFDYTDIKQRKRALNNFYLNLVGERVQVDELGNVTKRIPVKPMDIEQARKIQAMYGKEANPEMYERMGDMIDAFEQAKQAKAAGDEQAEMNAALTLDILMTDNTKDDVEGQLTKIIRTERTKGRDVATQQAQQIRELANVRKDLPELIAAMDRYIYGSPVAEYGMDEIAEMEESESARELRRGAISGYNVMREQAEVEDIARGVFDVGDRERAYERARVSDILEDIYGTGEEILTDQEIEEATMQEEMGRRERDTARMEQLDVLRGLYEEGEQTRTQTEIEQSRREAADEERRNMLDRMAIEAELAEQEYIEPGETEQPVSPVTPTQPIEREREAKPSPIASPIDTNTPISPKSVPISQRYESTHKRWKSMPQKQKAPFNMKDSITGEQIKHKEDVMYLPTSSETVKVSTYNKMMRGLNPLEDIKQPESPKKPKKKTRKQKLQAKKQAQQTVEANIEQAIKAEPIEEPVATEPAMSEQPVTPTTPATTPATPIPQSPDIEQVPTDTIEEQAYEQIAESESKEETSDIPQSKRSYDNGTVVAYKPYGKGEELTGTITKPIVQGGVVAGYKIKGSMGNDRIVMFEAGDISRIAEQAKTVEIPDQADTVEVPVEGKPKKQNVIEQDGRKYIMLNENKDDKVQYSIVGEGGTSKRRLWYKMRDEQGNLYLRSTSLKRGRGKGKGRYTIIPVTVADLEQAARKSEGGRKSVITRQGAIGIEGKFIKSEDYDKVGPAFRIIAGTGAGAIKTPEGNIQPFGELLRIVEGMRTGKSPANSVAILDENKTVSEDDLLYSYRTYLAEQGLGAPEGTEGFENVTFDDMLEAAEKEVMDYLAGKEYVYDPQEVQRLAEMDMEKEALGLSDAEYDEITSMPQEERDEVLGILGRADEHFTSDELYEMNNLPWREKVAKIIEREEDMGVDFPFGANEMSVEDVDDDVRLMVDRQIIEQAQPTQEIETPSTPIPTQRIHNIVNSITSKFKNAPNIEVVDSLDKLDSEIQAMEAEARGKGKRIFGVHRQSTNTVTLIAPNLRNENDIVRTILHESIGHYGLRGVLGDELNGVLDSVYNYFMSADKLRIAETAKDYEITLEQLQDPRYRRIVAEELVAQMAEDPTINRPLWKRVLRTITNAIMRVLGMKRSAIDAKNITITSENDIKGLIQSARDFVSESLTIQTVSPNTNGWANSILEQIDTDMITAASQDVMAKKESLDKVVNGNPNSPKNVADALTLALKDIYKNNEASSNPDSELSDAHMRIKQLDWYFDNKYLDDLVATVNAILAHKRGEIGKPKDISKLRRLLSSPEMWHQKVPAYNNIFKAIDRVKIDQHELLAEILEKNPDTGDDLFQSLREFAKNNEAEFEKFNSVVIENDRNNIEYAREERLRMEEIDNEISELQIPSEEPGQGKARIARISELIKERESLEEIYTKKIHDGLKKAGLSDEGIQAWYNVRQILDNTLNELIESGKVVIADYEKLSGKELTDIRNLVKSMGDLRGWYFPRVRKPGKYALSSTKGEQSDLRFFNNTVSREKYAQEQRKEGYKVKYHLTQNLPADMVSYYEAGVNLETMLGDVVDKITMETVTSLDDIDGLEYYTIDYVTTDGSVQQHLIVETPDPTYHDALKAGRRADIKGDGFYEIQRKSNDTKAYHFVIQPGQTAEDVQAHVVDSLNKQAEAYLALKDSFSAQVLGGIVQSMKVGGLRSSTKQRKETVGEEVTTGYEEDVLLAVNAYITRVAAGISKSKMANDAIAALHGHFNLDGTRVDRDDYDSSAAYYKQLKANRIDKQNQPNIYEAALRQIEDNLRPSDEFDRIVGTAKAIAVLKYLAGINVWASPFINTTTMATSVPGILHYQTGMPLTRVPRELGKAIKQYVMFRNVLRKGGNIRDLEKKGVNPATVRFMEKIVKNDLDQAQFYNDIIAGLQGRFGSMLNKFMNSWFGMKIFEESERLNRGATMIAAFNYLANKKGIRKGKAGDIEFDIIMEQAIDVSNGAHGLYGKSATPYIGQGKGVAARTAKSVLTFTKFPHTYLMQLEHLMGEAKDNKQARNAAVYMIAAPVILGGIGAEAVSGVALGIDKAVGEPLMNMVRAFTGEDDPEGAFYDLIEDMFGTTAKSFAQEGLIGTVSPVSIRRSLAIELPSIQQNVPLSLYKDFTGGVSALFKGDLYRAGEKALPRFISTPIRAYREYTQGASTTGGVPIWHGKEIIKPTTGEFVSQLFAFSPATTSRQKEEVYTWRRIEEKYRQQRTELYAKLRRLILDSNGQPKKKDIEKIAKEMIEFNVDLIKKRKENPMLSAINTIKSREIRDAINSMSEPGKLEKARYVKEVMRKNR